MDSTVQSTNIMLRALVEPSSRTRDTVARLSEEFASRRTADVGAAVNHDFAAVAEAQRDLDIAESLRFAALAGQRVAQSAARSWDRISAEVENLRSAVQPHVAGGQYPRADSVLAASEAGLEAAITALNARVDGRAVFAGGRADANAVAPPADVLADLTAIAGAATDVGDLRTQVSAYFFGAGDFATNRVTPAAAEGFGIQLGRGETASFGQTPLDDESRTVLHAFGELFALSSSAFGDTQDARDYYALQGATIVAGAADAAVNQRATVGTLEARVASALETIDADRFAAERRRDDLIGIDPFETGTRLQDETARLESIYTLTARLGRLRLTDYL